jgi:hypothetical protein
MLKNIFKYDFFKPCKYRNKIFIVKWKTIQLL